MDALYALHNRVSSGKLIEPAPSASQRENIYRAALRAADHGCLRPWRFLEIEGDARARLGEIYLQAMEAADGPLSEARREKALAMPQRAPLIIVAITALVDHPKVPHIEQRQSTAGAVQAMLTAAFAEGVGAYWRTGPLASDPMVAERLGLSANERIEAFVYLGTPKKSPRQAPHLSVEDFFDQWSGN